MADKPYSVTKYYSEHELGQITYRITEKMGDKCLTLGEIHVVTWLGFIELEYGIPKLIEDGKMLSEERNGETVYWLTLPPKEEPREK